MQLTALENPQYCKDQLPLSAEERRRPQEATAADTEIQKRQHTRGG